MARGRKGSRSARAESKKKGSSGSSPTWKSYEDVTHQLLNRFKDELQLDNVERTVERTGRTSGTTWHLEAIAYQGSEEFIIECKQHGRRLSQEVIGGFAYRIKDVGAKGGYVVTPIGLQDGAKLVAGMEKIETITLNREATTDHYIMSFFDRIFLGATDRLHVGLGEGAGATIVIKEADGSIRRFRSS